MRKLPNSDFNFGFAKLTMNAGGSAQGNKNQPATNTSSASDNNSVGRAPVQDLDTINL